MITSLGIIGDWGAQFSVKKTRQDCDGLRCEKLSHMERWLLFDELHEALRDGWRLRRLWEVGLARQLRPIGMRKKSHF